MSKEAFRSSVIGILLAVFTCFLGCSHKSFLLEMRPSCAYRPLHPFLYSIATDDTQQFTIHLPCRLAERAEKITVDNGHSQ
jgi:hypothetical protein